MKIVKYQATDVSDRCSDLNMLKSYSWGSTIFSPNIFTLKDVMR